MPCKRAKFNQHRKKLNGLLLTYHHFHYNSHRDGKGARCGCLHAGTQSYKTLIRVDDEEDLCKSTLNASLYIVYVICAAIADSGIW